ncbi:MAG: hypothetical protein F4W92_06315 [Gammaproteobacteria bacterium]|nr:hypothetical protein [Gammaproteobacteria bacterium]
MTPENHEFEAKQGKLPIIVFLGVLCLFPIKALAEEDSVGATQSAPLDGPVTDSSHQAIFLLGDHDSVFDQRANLYETLTLANKDELVGLLKDSLSIVPDSVRHETIFAIASRFTAIDPLEALVAFNELAEQERTPFLEGLFSEWCVSNLDEAVAAAVKLNRQERLTVFMAIVSVRDDLTISQLNSIASELGHPDYASDVASQMKMVEFADDPISAWDVLIYDGLDNSSQLDTLVHVAEAVIEKHGFHALFHLHEPFDRGFRIVGETTIYYEVLNTLVKNDPENTWEYIRNGSTGTFDEPLEKVHLQDQDPFSKREQAYMTDRVQRLLMYSWADTYPDEVLSDIEQIPYHLQPLACERALAELVTTDPERTVELIGSLTPYGSNRNAALEEIVRRWSATDPSAALDWVLSAPEMENIADGKAFSTPSTRTYIMRTVLASLALEDPERALQVATREYRPEYFESWIMAKLARSDLESALEVLPLVIHTTPVVAGVLVELGEVERGMKMLLQYEDTSDEEVSWFWFFRSWAVYNAVDLIERMEEFEPKLRTAAASAIDYIFIPELTGKQNIYIRSFLDDARE